MDWNLNGSHDVARPTVVEQGIFEDGIGFIQRFSVDVDLLGSNLYNVTWKPNDPFDVVFGIRGLVEEPEHNDVSASNIDVR
jgi:hypothetical protein